MVQIRVESHQPLESWSLIDSLPDSWDSIEEPSYTNVMFLHTVQPDSVEERCAVYLEHSLETHARQHISSMCSTYPYMENNSSQ